VVRLIVAGALLCLSACASVATRPAELRVIARPENARVYLDDRFVATARVLSRRPESVRAGVHYMTITADGYFPHDVELDLPSGLTTVEISLRPVPP
jgi:hypothetical protein